MRRLIIQFYKDLHNNGKNIKSDNPISLNQWHNITAIFGSKGMKLFIDTRLVSSNLDVTGIEPGVLPIHRTTIIGNYNGQYFYKGYIDDVRIYNRILSESEIQALYQLKN